MTDFQSKIISVIIPTCNRNDLLKKCLDALHPDVQNFPIEAYEVIISDDSKNNIAKELIDNNYNWVKWLSGPKKGPAANRNNGAQQANGEWLAFVDDDCIPTEDWLKAYYLQIKNRNYNVLEGLTDAERPKRRFDEESPINLKGGQLWSCNFCIRKITFLEIDGFDEGFPFPALEDTDFNHRIRKIEKVLFCPNAKVIHPWRRTKPYQGYKKWLQSNKYYLDKYEVKRDFKFRFSRFKILLGSIISSTRDLMKFSSRGLHFYFEKIWFHFLMIFI